MKHQKLISEFKTQLDKLENGNGDILFRAESGITLVERYIKQLQAQIGKKPFASQEEEINFFKHIKPQFFSKLIYYGRLFNIESKRPRGSNAAQVKYLKNQIEKFQIFFNDNLEFYNYYRRGAISLDEQYFIRGNRDLRLPLESFHFINMDDLKENPMERPSKLFWTGSKTDLIELLYALHYSKCINSGTADIKELASHFEHFYNVDLGNYYHTFIEIRSRKTGRTKFLDRLIEMLKQRMEGLDD